LATKPLSYGRGGRTVRVHRRLMTFSLLAVRAEKLNGGAPKADDPQRWNATGCAHILMTSLSLLAAVIASNGRDGTMADAFDLFVREKVVVRVEPFVSFLGTGRGWCLFGAADRLRPVVRLAKDNGHKG